MLPIALMTDNAKANDTIIVNSPSNIDQIIKNSSKQDANSLDTLIPINENVSNLPDDRLIKLSDSLIVIKRDKERLEKQISSLQESLLKADKCLISVAANALYVPYEAYSVKEIAIRSFETVNDIELKKKHELKYRLLKTYSNDVKKLLSFIVKSKNDIEKNRFTHDAIDVLLTFQLEDYYQSYHEYDDWKATFLGRMIADVEKQLKQFDRKTHQIQFDMMIKELQNCIKTEEDL